MLRVPCHDAVVALRRGKDVSRLDAGDLGVVGIASEGASRLVRLPACCSRGVVIVDASQSLCPIIQVSVKSSCELRALQDACCWKRSLAKTSFCRRPLSPEHNT